MTRIVFEEVSFRSRWTFHCANCGKRIVKCKKFMETLNPFNVHKVGPLKGRVKSHADILASLRVKVDDWQASSIRCSKCETRP